ncbi:hypothetical protein P7K49_024045 [Saguinus oedipus]|uniref:Uncharacterized protein n=1 Tax=Saguinus oedipus TaxID=9490 RepID=A0ABQ9UNF4_SAGOE|nr:hypothetical protein P7K49_024045 [Saguinus oedipus]
MGDLLITKGVVFSAADTVKRKAFDVGLLSTSTGEDAMTGDTDKYLGPQDLKELGRKDLRSFSSDRSYTLNRSSYARDSMMIEELLVPSKEQVLPGLVEIFCLVDCGHYLVSNPALFHVPS